MSRFKVPNTYVIIFCALLVCALSTWFVPGAQPQTWQVFSALYDGFSQQAGIIAFVLVIGGAFWVVNSTKAVDEGIMKFIAKVQALERFKLIRHLGSGNIVITLVMLLFGLFGAVFGMSEETIAFVAVAIPLAKRLGYDEFVGVCMVYVAAHVGFAGAMLNPFTIGIAQDMSDLPLFSGIEYRIICWLILMTIAIAFTLWYASRIRKPVAITEEPVDEAAEVMEKGSGIKAWVCFAILMVVLVLFSVFYASDCVISLGQKSFAAPWLLWVLTALFAMVSVIALRRSARLFILDMLLFCILFMVTGVMGYGWYLPEICALFLALAVASGLAAGYSSDDIAKEFIAGAKDIFSAALIIGFAAGIIVILQNGQVIDIMLDSMASALDGSGRAGALGTMYGIQTFINLFIPSASAKAAVTMPIMAPFSDIIGVSRQATVLAFQFGDGFTNMITPCSGVLMAVLSVARIPYEKWFRWIWKFILFLILVGFLLLLPTLFLNLPGF
ncbi:MAG: AbgT family transporter [Bacteroidales bacterium]|nr:AbgT family transporter [Bacteroidales bacterium]